MIIWTSGGIDILAVNAGLAVPEAWIWKGDRLYFHLLREDKYVTASRGNLLPKLDLALIQRCMAEASQTLAIARLREAWHRC